MDKSLKDGGYKTKLECERKTAMLMGYMGREVASREVARFMLPVSYW